VPPLRMESGPPSASYPPTRSSSTAAGASTT
jgi:hypothetical protein